MQFTEATRQKLFGRVAIVGPTGSGKTVTSLIFAFWLAAKIGKRLAVIDTERGSARKCLGREVEMPDGSVLPLKFDVLELDTFAPATYVNAIKLAESTGHGVCLVDSLSHAWQGKDGTLDIVDKAAAKARDNKFAGWRTATPEQNKLVDAMLGCGMHLFVTMRTKTEWVLEDNERGKKQPRKIGTQPIQRDGIEYEFDLVAEMDVDHVFSVGKSRCDTLDGISVRKPGVEVIKTFHEWLEIGEPRPETTPAPDSQNHKEPEASRGAKEATPAGNSDQPPSSSDEGEAFITKDQQRELAVAVADAGHEPVDVKAWLKHAYNADSSQRVRVRDFRSILIRLKNKAPLVVVSNGANAAGAS